MTNNRRTRTRLLAGLLLAALAGFLVYAFRPRPVPVDLVPAGVAPLAVTVNEDGKARLRERYTVSSPLSGRLDRIVLKAGDPVEAGTTVLATLIPSVPELLDPRVRAQAEARVRSSEAAEMEAEARLERAKVQERHARIEFERGEDLHEKKVISLQDLESLDEKRLVATSEVRAAEFARKVAAFETEQARAVLAQTADSAELNPESLGGRHEIVAPVSGRVLRVLEESATVVQPGTPLIEVGDPSDLEIEVDVLSQDAVNISPGARVVVEHWGGGEALAGRVRVVEPSAFTKVSALGVEEQRVNVIADFTSPGEERGALGDGFRVEARIVTWEGEEVL